MISVRFQLVVNFFGNSPEVVVSSFVSPQPELSDLMILCNHLQSVEGGEERVGPFAGASSVPGGCVPGNRTRNGQCDCGVPPPT